MLSLPLCCMVFGVLVFSPKTDGGSLTWEQPPPNETVQSANPVDHSSSRQLYVGTINATLNWQFRLNQLNFGSLVISLNGTPIGGVGSLGSGLQPGFENDFGIDWNPNQKLVKLFIFKVTIEKNGTFTCQVDANEVTGFVTKNFQFRSNVQVHVVDPATSNIVASSDQNITAPAELTLNCSADGKPKPTITWTRLSDNTVVTMPLNIIRGKNKESYRCTAHNGIGNPLIKDVIVNILFSPKVTLAKKFFVGREQNASLICQVEGNPEPLISWSHCDAPNVFCDKQYLNISKLQTARSNYNCTARNALGIDSATTVVFIGGENIYLRLSVSGKCDNKDSVWKILQKELGKVFTNTQGYSGADLIGVRCGSLIFDVVLKFGTKVAEDDTISFLQSSIVDGKLGELSVNVSYIHGIPPVGQSTTAAPTRTTLKSDDNTRLIIGAVLGGLAFVALILFIVWYVRKKKCSAETKVSDNTVSAQGRKGKGQNGGDEAAYASTSMLPHSKRPVEKTNQGTVQALPMYAQVDKTKKTSNKGGAAQRQRQPGELQYAEVEHVTSGRSLPRKSSSEPIKPSNEEIVYADLV
ncbi:uncharacterized protein LOC141893222 isoform X2 [Acropora palmata]|uniref:uncharacterized protein LOC141893222 isoform X2 n=1 Tax=Acropora palmata TaxID=6131 RepID=UPI003DA09F5A